MFASTHGALLIILETAVITQAPLPFKACISCLCAIDCCYISCLSNHVCSAYSEEADYARQVTPLLSDYRRRTQAEPPQHESSPEAEMRRSDTPRPASSEVS
jgi:hypothetical protein